MWELRSKLNPKQASWIAIVGCQKPDSEHKTMQASTSPEMAVEEECETADPAPVRRGMEEE